MIIAYKLMRLKKDGNLGSLFINRKANIPSGIWLEAENLKTEGFAERKGWHCTFEPIAPHLKTELSNGEKRIWVKVQLEDYTIYNRPFNQGGQWVLANKMKVIGII